jgi:hypothetical protein
MKKKKRVLMKTRTGKRKRVPPLSMAILVRLWPDELDELDAWISEQEEPRPTRPEAIRRRLGYSPARMFGTGGRRQYARRDKGE